MSNMEMPGQEGMICGGKKLKHLFGETIGGLRSRALELFFDYF